MILTHLPKLQASTWFHCEWGETYVSPYLWCVPDRKISFSLYLCILILMCPRTNVSPIWCVPIPMCPHTAVFSYLCVPILMCSHTYVSQFWCVPVPMCFHTNVSPYLCVPIPVCPHAYVSPYLYVPVPICPQQKDWCNPILICPCTNMSPYWYVPNRKTNVSPYLCVPVPMCPRTNMSPTERLMCPCTSMSRFWCLPVPMCVCVCVPIWVRLRFGLGLDTGTLWCVRSLTAVLTVNIIIPPTPTLPFSFFSDAESKTACKHSHHWCFPQQPHSAVHSKIFLNIFVMLFVLHKLFEYLLVYLNCPFSILVWFKTGKVTCHESVHWCLFFFFLPLCAIVLLQMCPGQIIQNFIVSYLCISWHCLLLCSCYSKWKSSMDHSKWDR